MKRTKVYIAGPMTGGTGSNFNMAKIHEAIETHFKLIELGFIPHCPHLTVFCELMQPHRITYEQWLELDKSYVEDSDVLLRLPGVSPGADKEMGFARDAGIPVVHSVEELLENFE